MGDPRSSARSHGPFPAVASKILSVPVGVGKVVQVVKGSQPGLLLCWEDPSGSDFSIAGAIEADRPDVYAVAHVGNVWLVWPETLLSSEAVTLRSWSSPTSFVPPPWERSGREERKMLARGHNVNVPNGGLVLYTSGDPDRDEGDVELTRWSTVCGYINVNTGGLTAEIEWFFRLQIEHSGNWWEAYAERGTRNAVWQDQAEGGQRRMLQFSFPIPMGNWRIGLFHVDMIGDDVHYNIFCTTQAFARFTI